MYDIAVCDDHFEDRLFLIERILMNGIGSTEARIHEYASGEELLEGMKSIDFSLIFLDIQMDGINGEEVALRMREENSMAILVFYSGLPNPTPENFEVQPYRYIKKVMPIEKIDEYVEASILHMINEKQKPMIIAKVNGNHYRIPLDYILYFEKHKKGTKVFILEEIYKTYKIESDKDELLPELMVLDKMDALYLRLQKYGFGSPHNSYIINFKYLTECSSQHLKLEGVSESFPISRRRAKEFLLVRDLFFQLKYI